MQIKITSAFISVFYKDGLLPLAQHLQNQSVTIYSTGGTLQYLQENSINCVAVEEVTGYPSILGGRVKTLHPKVFGGILARRQNEQDLQELHQYEIPVYDLVIVDLYPFEETVAAGKPENEIIEKIDIGGVSLIRAAAKNFSHVCVISQPTEYSCVLQQLKDNNNETDEGFRKNQAAAAFTLCAQYDVAIANYFTPSKTLRYGENPHQAASFTGNLQNLFSQLHGKELSFNNLLDVDAAMQLAVDMEHHYTGQAFFSIIKHNNVCGAALAADGLSAWQNALAGDKESAFGGILYYNGEITTEMANSISEIFFEVLMAKSFNAEALVILQSKKNRILLTINALPKYTKQNRSLLNGTLQQDHNQALHAQLTDAGGRVCTSAEKNELVFANILCKHLKSNAIAITKNNSLVGKGCGQTSRIDALKQALEKAKQFNVILQQAVLASDAFFPFDDCVKLAHSQGIQAYIQPGGSIRDEDTINYCKANNLALLITGTRHFRH
jgi:phosphoribosylaminoimidazolecarboxamide formyltransferase / IMP cyclohydrolase